MKTFMYSLFDVAAQVFTPVFHALNDSVAKRNIANDMQQPGHALHTNPEDFHLYKVAEYDDGNAQVHNYPVNELICRATDLIVHNLLDRINPDEPSTSETNAIRQSSGDANPEG